VIASDATKARRRRQIGVKPFCRLQKPGHRAGLFDSGLARSATLA
jgi:hypothetical protein